MDSSLVISWMIIICLVFAGVILFSKRLKDRLRFAIQAVCGVLGSVIFNFLLTPFGLSIGVNYLNAFVVGILGLPGFVSLYLLNWLM